jgi:hypothetical protein
LTEIAFALPEQLSAFQEGDEVILVTHKDHLAELKERWAPQSNSAEGGVD